MAIDMKQTIADAVRTLLIDKNKKRITVKDIVEECNITRQAFYYHFADIPELLQWIASKQTDELRERLEKGLEIEEIIKCWFLVYINARKDIQKGVNSNYGQEIKEIIVSQILRMFKEAADKELASLDEFERNLIVKYHAYAAMGLLSAWTEEDTNQIDRIVHDIYLLLIGKLDQL